MAEIIGAAAASLELGSSIVQLKAKFQGIKHAPDEVKALVDETTHLNNLLLFLSRREERISPQVQPIPELIDIQDFCKAAAENLLQCTRELDIGIQKARCQGSFKAVLKEKTINRLRQKLESAKLSLVMAQNAFSSIVYHEQMLQTIDTNTLVKAALAGSSMAGSSSSDAALSASHQVAQIAQHRTGSLRSVYQSTTDHKYSQQRTLRTQYRFATPTRWLGWTLHIRAWRYFDNWTFNFRIWNHLPDDSPIFKHAYNGDLNQIQRILWKKEASVTALNSNDDSPIHIAARRGFIDIVRLLIEHGADVNHVNAEGNTCLTGLAFSVNDIPSVIQIGPSRYDLAATPSINDQGGFEALFRLLDENGSEDFVNNAERLLDLFDGGRNLDAVKELQHASKLVASYIWPPYKDLTLQQKLRNCAANETRNPKVFLERLGGPVTEACLGAQTWQAMKPEKGRWLDSSIWILIARAIGRVMSPEMDGAGDEIRAEFLGGWRKILQQVVECGGVSYFGTQSILDTFLSARLHLADFRDIGGLLLTEYVRVWVHELQQAGMSIVGLERFARHEVAITSANSFLVTTWRPARSKELWDCNFHVTKLYTGPDPSSWRMLGVWTIGSNTNNASADKLAHEIPGAWGQDESDRDSKHKVTSAFSYHSRDGDFVNGLPGIEVIKPDDFEDDSFLINNSKVLTCSLRCGRNLDRAERRIKSGYIPVYVTDNSATDAYSNGYRYLWPLHARYYTEARE